MSTSKTTCLALAEDLCKCSVSPNIRAGVSTEAALPEGEADPPGDMVLLLELLFVFNWSLVEVLASTLCGDGLKMNNISKSSNFSSILEQPLVASNEANVQFPTDLRTQQNHPKFPYRLMGTIRSLASSDSRQIASPCCVHQLTRSNLLPKNSIGSHRWIDMHKEPSRAECPTEEGEGWPSISVCV